MQAAAAALGRWLGAPFQRAQPPVSDTPAPSVPATVPAAFAIRIAAPATPAPQLKEAAKARQPAHACRNPHDKAHGDRALPLPPAEAEELPVAEPTRKLPAVAAVGAAAPTLDITALDSVAPILDSSTPVLDSSALASTAESRAPAAAPASWATWAWQCARGFVDACAAAASCDRSWWGAWSRLPVASIVVFAVLAAGAVNQGRLQWGNGALTADWRQAASDGLAVAWPLGHGAADAWWRLFTALVHHATPSQFALQATSALVAVALLENALGPLAAAAAFFAGGATGWLSWLAGCTALAWHATGGAAPFGSLSADALDRCAAVSGGFQDGDGSWRAAAMGAAPAAAAAAAWLLAEVLVRRHKRSEQGNEVRAAVALAAGRPRGCSVWGCLPGWEWVHAGVVAAVLAASAVEPAWSGHPFTLLGHLGGAAFGFALGLVAGPMDPRRNAAELARWLVGGLTLAWLAGLQPAALLWAMWA